MAFPLDVVHPEPAEGLGEREDSENARARSLSVAEGKGK